MRFAKMEMTRGAPGWLLPFLIGFVPGVLLTNAGVLMRPEQSSLLDEYTLGRLKYMEINCNTFLLYVFEKRMSTLWILMLFCVTAIGLYVLWGYLVWTGFAFGTLLSVAVIRYGIKGILLLLTGVFPHYLCYVPAYLMLIRLCRRIRTRGQGTMQYIISFAGINIVVIIGILLESYVNSMIVTKILNIF